MPHFELINKQFYTVVRTIPLMYYKSNSSVVTLRHFLNELYLFSKLEYAILHNYSLLFFLHVLTNLAEILHKF